MERVQTHSKHPRLAMDMIPKPTRLDSKESRKQELGGFSAQLGGAMHWGRIRLWFAHTYHAYTYGKNGLTCNSVWVAIEPKLKLWGGRTRFYRKNGSRAAIHHHICPEHWNMDVHVIVLPIYVPNIKIK